MSAFVVSNIKPDLTIDGNSQRFLFANELLPEPRGSISADNTFVPAVGTPSITDYEVRNNTLAGYRLRLETSNTDTYGKFKINRFLGADPVGEDLVTFDNDGTVTFDAPVSFEDLNVSKLGIGIDPTVNGRIQFAASYMVNKLSLYNAGVDDYQQSGFGANSLGTLYHAPAFTSHTFYLGDSATTPLRVDALGITLAELRPINADFRRIMFYDEGENVHQVYNIGIKDLGGSNYAIHNQVSKLNAGFTWGAGLSPSSSADLMSLRGDESTQKINLKLMNPLEAAIGLPAYTQFDLVNSTSGGVRFLHTSSTTDLVGLGSLKVQLVNSSGSGLDAFTVNDGAFGPQITFNGPAVFDAGITSRNGVNNLFTGNALTYNALTITNQNVSGNTFIQFNSVYKIGYDNAISRTYIDSTVSFNLTFSGTSALYVDHATRNIGIGTTAPHAPLQFASVVANRKAVLFEDNNNDHQFYGFGVNNGVLRYQVGTTTADHVFYAGSSASTSLEAARITGTGNFISPGTIYGRRPSGGCYMQANATATAVAANTWTKVAGATTSVTLNLFSMSANNRLTYTGTPTIIALIIGSVTASHAAVLGATLGFSVFKNGGQIIPSAMFRQSGLNEVSHVSFVATISLATNDFIEVFCQSTAATNITASYLTLEITST